MKIYKKSHKKYFTKAISTTMKVKCWKEKNRHWQHEKKKGKRGLETISKALRFSGNYYQPKIAGVWGKGGIVETEPIQ